MSRRRSPTIGRRALLAGLAGLPLLPVAARVAAPPPGGTVGIVVGRAGPPTLTFAATAGPPPTPAVRWHIGSNTKAMTAALYARLVERGALHWGTSVAGLFPGLPSDPAWASVTAEQVMAHAAGLTDAAIDGAWLSAHHRDDSSAPAQRQAFVAELLSRPPAGEAGRYRYGNAGYILIGAAIEQATKRSWEQALREQLFAPLGITGAGFGAPTGGSPWGHGAAGEPVDPAGIADNPPILGPAGRVHLTPGDYARFLALFLNNGAPLIGKATLAHLLSPPAPGHPYAGGWSLGGPAAQPAAVLSHNGSNTLWYATAIVERAQGTAYAAITDRGGAAGEAAVQAMLRRLRPA